MPTLSAASRPLPSRMVALRSLDWLRMGVVAVRDTYMAISKQTVSIVPRMTSAVTGSTAPPAMRRSLGPASAFMSTSMDPPSGPPRRAVGRCALSARVPAHGPCGDRLLTLVSPFTVHGPFVRTLDRSPSGNHRLGSDPAATGGRALVPDGVDRVGCHAPDEPLRR